MRYVCSMVAAAAALCFLSPAAVSAQDLTITNYQFVSEQRISRYESYVTYKADLVNNGAAKLAVTATVSSLAPNVQVVPGQTNLHFGASPSHSQVPSADTFTILVDRTVTFDFTSLQWSFLAPVAKAGANITAKIGSTVTLDGAGSSNPSGYGSLTYFWKFVMRPPGTAAVLSGSNDATPSFTVDVAGDYVIQLTVSNGGGTDTAVVTVSTSNSKPVANPGPNQTVAVGATATLNGSGSSDVDGDPLTYAWTLISKPASSAAALTGATTVSPSFTVDKAGSYVARLIVNDGKTDSDPATVTISTQNVAPVANAGPSQSVPVGTLVHLNGAGSTDVDGDALTYRWSLLSVPSGSNATLSDPAVVSPTFTVDLPGSYVAQLVVNDGKVDSAPSTVTISTGSTLAPTANAGANQTVLPHGSVVSLTGGGTDPQGLTLTYLWSLITKPDGSTAVLSGSTLQNPVFTADLPGSYVAQLIVNNGYVSSAPSTVTITTTNTAPVADAGANATVAVSATVNLDGSNSSDADHDPITYSWSLLSKPSGSNAALSATTSAAVSFVADVAGVYVAQLIVRDGFASSSPVTVTITAGSKVLTVSPNPVNVASGASATVTVNLGSPAGAGGQVVKIGIADTQVATAPDTLLIPEGQSLADVTVTAAIGSGATLLVASAAGYTPGTVMIVTASPTITLSLDSGTVGVSRAIAGHITLNAPAPAGGVSIMLSASPSGVVSILPQTLTIPAGATKGDFTVGGEAKGYTLISAVGPGYATGTAWVNVSELGQIKLSSGVTTAPGQSAPLQVSLATGAPVGGVTIALSSSDPGKVMVLPASVFIAAQATTPDTPVVVYGVNFGSATVSAAAPGFIGDSQKVEVAGGLAFLPTTLTMASGDTKQLTLKLSGTVQAPAGGLTVTINSSNSSVVRAPAAVTIPAGSNSVQVEIVGAGDGVATISANASPNLTATADVTVVTLGGATLAPVSVGIGQSAPLSYTLSQFAPAGGVTVTFVSSDQTKATVSPSIVTVPAGQTTPPVPPQVTGVAMGTATITASAPGFKSASAAALVSAQLWFAQPSIVINLEGTQNLTLMLSGPAPSPNGLTVNLTSSDAAVASVPATVTFPAGLNSVAVPVTPHTLGNVKIRASRLPELAETVADVSVKSLLPIQTPANLNVSMGQGASLSVVLPAPSSENVLVSFTSSDATKVTISPSSVVIQAGKTSPDTAPVVNGVNIGTATITAFASAYATASTAAQVSATMSFVSSSVTIGASGSLTLKLSAQAPAGGVPVSLVASNPAAATVPATVTFPAGSDTVAVPVTGVNEGSTVVTAGAPPYIPFVTANVTVKSPGSLITPANISVAMGQSVTFPVTLSAAASSAVTVTLTSSDTGKLTVSPATVVIAAGATAPATQPTITGVGVGSVNVTATAPLFTSSTSLAQVTASVSFAPQTLTITGPQNITLTLSAPAPAGGLTVNLSSANTAIVTVPATATFATGATTANVMLNPVGGGTAVIHASLPPTIPDATASITVQSGILLPDKVVVGPGQNVQFPVKLAQPAPVGGLVVTLASSDASKLTITQPTVIFAEGATEPNGTPRLNGVSYGYANVTASAYGYVGSVRQVTVGAALSFSPSNVTFVTGAAQTLALTLSAPAPAGGLSVSITSSATGVATAPASVTFPADSVTVNVAVTGVAPGTATLTASTSMPTISGGSATVTIKNPGSINLPVTPTVGLGKVAAFPISIDSPAPSGGVTVTLVSSDTAFLQFSSSTVVIPQGATTPNVQPQMEGFDVGPVTVTATAPGFTTSTVQVKVTATVVFDPPTLDLVGTGASSIKLVLSAGAPLAPAPGITMTITSSNPAVLQVPGVMTFYGDGSIPTTLVIPVNALAQGSATITAGAPPYVPNAVATVNVRPPGSIVLPSGVTVAPGQSAAYPVSLTSVAPTGGLTITLSSGSPAKVSIAPSTVTVPAGQTTPTVQPQVTGLDFGSSTISATATGYGAATGPVQVTSTLSFASPNLNFTGLGMQNIALNLPVAAPTGLTVTLASDTAAVATVPAAVTIPQGSKTVNVPVTAVSLGSAKITATAVGITGASLNVSVASGGTIGLPATLPVGLGQSVDLVVTLPAAAPSGGVVVTLASSDTTKATVSLPTITIPAGATTVAPAPKVTGVGLGTATITASAPGYSNGTTQAQVSLSLSFSAPLTLIGLETQSATLTLSGAAPAGGVTVNLSSSNAAAATVPATVTVAAGATTAPVPVTSVGVGSAVIKASYAGAPDATVNVTVVSGGAVGMPAALAVNLRQSVAVQVTLPKAAPAGGATVTLTSSDTNTATVAPAIVQIPAGQVSPASAPMLTGVKPGAASITASAPGYTNASSPVTVSATVSFAVTDFKLVTMQAQNATLNLSAAAPSTGLTVNLSSSATGVATVPASVTFAPNASSVNVPVTPLSNGVAVIHASGTNIPDATMNVTVAVGGAIPVLNASIGQNLQKEMSITFPSVAPAGGLQVTFTSSDAAKLLIAGRPGDTGTATLTVKLAEGLSSLSGVYLQGLVNSGTANVTVSAPGYTSGIGNVTLTPSGFVLAGPNGIGVPSISASTGGTTTLTVSSARLDAALNYAEVQALRGGFTASVAVTSNPTSVGTITSSPLAFTGGVSSLTTGFAAIAAGGATITAVAPSGFSTPANSGNTLQATVSTGLATCPANVAVGRGLQTPTLISFTGLSPAGGATFTIASNDANRLLFALTPGAAGSPSISLSVQGSRTQSPEFYVQGLGAPGAVSYSISAPGIASLTCTATVAASGIMIAGPFGPGNTLLTTSGASPSTLTLTAGMLDSGGSFLAQQNVAGSALSFVVKSADQTVGSVLTENLSIPVGSSTATTLFQPWSVGSTSVNITQPAGFTDPSQYASLPVNVIPPGMSITSGISVGRNLQTSGTLVLGQPAPSGGLSVTLTSNSPTQLKLSNTATGAGSTSIVINVPAGSTSGTYYIQGADSAGSPTYTATASGYASRTASVDLTDSGFIITGPFGIGQQSIPVSLASGSTVNYLVQAAQLDPVSKAYLGTQPVAGGITASVPIATTNASAGTYTTPVSITAGNDTASGQFTPKATGQATLTTTAPSGYGTPANYGALLITVNP